MRIGRFKLALLSLICLSRAAAGLAQQNPDTTKTKQPVATVGGQAIYDDDLIPSVQAQLLPLRRQEYEVQKRALDSLIEQKLLEAAAKKNGITTEKLLQQEVDAKVPEPTATE